MRIAIIGSRGVPAATGGVERVVEQLSAELAGRGHEVLVYARPWYLRARPGAAPPVGVRALATAGLSGKHTDTLTHTATAMWDVLRRKVDLVHVFSPGPALLSFLPAAARLPIAWTVQGRDWTAPRWSRPARLALRVGLKCGMKFASAVSTVSLSLRDWLTDKYRRKVEYIPNGVAPARLRPPRQIAPWGLAKGGYGLFVGRIVPGKSVDLLVRAWGMLAPKIPLVVVGDSVGEPSYTALCRRQADPSVRFVGPRFGAVLEELYSNAAVVIQPSMAEGMSLVLLEAAAHGRCVIARDMPANRDALGEAMAAFTEDSPSALAETIQRCLNDPVLREQIGRAARKRVRQQFAWPNIARRYEELYRHALLARAAA